jgi:tetratricopeptide (TPR) repeat protein
LRIDCILRRADYAKFYNDIENAKTDYTEAIKLCLEFPDGNERIMGSAHFSLGKVYLDIGQRQEAQVHFEKV